MPGDQFAAVKGFLSCLLATMTKAAVPKWSLGSYDPSQTAIAVPWTIAVAINWQLSLGRANWPIRMRRESTDDSKASCNVENGPAVGSNSKGSSSMSETSQVVEHSIAYLECRGQMEANWFAEGGSWLAESADLLYFLERIFRPPAEVKINHRKPARL